MITQEEFDQMTIDQALGFFDHHIESNHEIYKYWRQHRPRAILNGRPIDKPFGELLGELPEELAVGYARFRGIEVDLVIRLFFLTQCKAKLEEEITEAVWPGHFDNQTPEAKAFLNED